MPKLNLKRLRNFLILFFIIIYIGIFVFEGIFNFNQTTISSIFVKYDDFAEPLYLILLTLGIATGLLTAIIVLAGFFIFNIYSLLILTILGVILGISLVFVLARILGHKSFMEYLKVKENRMEKLKEIFIKDSVALTVLFNFIFFLPSTFGGIIGGLADTKLARLIPLSIFGNLVNQIAFVFFLYGTEAGRTDFLIPSIIALILNSAIPILIYRKNIKDVFMIAFRKK